MLVHQHCETQASKMLLLGWVAQSRMHISHTTCGAGCVDVYIIYNTYIQRASATLKWKILYIHICMHTYVRVHVCYSICVFASRSTPHIMCSNIHGMGYIVVRYSTDYTKCIRVCVCVCMCVCVYMVSSWVWFQVIYMCVVGWWGMYCIIYCTVLYCTVLYCTVLLYNTWCYRVSYDMCIVLYCIVLGGRGGVRIDWCHMCVCYT